MMGVEMGVGELRSEEVLKLMAQTVKCTFKQDIKQTSFEVYMQSRMTFCWKNVTFYNHFVSYMNIFHLKC